MSRLMEEIIPIIIIVLVVLGSFIGKIFTALMKSGAKAENRPQGGKSPSLLEDFIRALVESPKEPGGPSHSPSRIRTSQARAPRGKIQKKSLIEDIHGVEEDAEEHDDLHADVDSGGMPPPLPAGSVPGDVARPSVAHARRSAFAREIARRKKFAVICHDIIGPPKGLDN